ncbi:MAG: cache domain-containing protein [Campylobacterota bacterium]|nr:cache domain-containing protein [Campylobacterota bacterium]
MPKIKKYLILLFVICIISVPSSINYLKKQKTDDFKKNSYLDTVNQTKLYLKTIIKEKQNTTATIGIGLSNNETVINSLKKSSKSTLDLSSYSAYLKRTTPFKNVWFQLISKEGISLQRSWTGFKNDNIAKARLDLQKILKKPEIMNTISVGKFDMTFKSMIPVYDKGSEFLGIIEVITHFNSISKKLDAKGTKAIILADKRYKKQVTKAFTNKFLGDYYIANLDSDSNLLQYLSSKGIEKYLNRLKEESNFIDKSINSLVSYYSLDDVEGEPMGHFIMFNSLEDIDLSELNEIVYIYNLSSFVSVVILILLFYFLYSLQIQSVRENIYDMKLVVIVIFIFIVLSISLYYLVQRKYKSDIDNYKNNLQMQTLQEYKSILNNNKNIAKFVFERELDKQNVKELVKNRKRDELNKLLVSTYRSLRLNYNIRQIHFHLPDCTSFLRLHRPNKFGDNLKGIRESVEYVNKNLQPFHGFEEGRIYNGFRHVFPLIEGDTHIGSVEVSFDVYSLIDNYLNNFKASRINFLINKDIIVDKVFKEEQSNYIKSPVKGFYFDKLVIQKLEDSKKGIVPKAKTKEQFEYISKNILSGYPFVIHFENIGEITVVIPLVNKLNDKVVGSINISKSDKFIDQRLGEFKQLVIVILLILSLIIIFILREILSKIKLNNELKKSQIILDSQKSIIMITDGMYLKGANKRLFEFFGFESFISFKKDHDCICDHFEKEGERYIQKQMGDKSWFEYIKNHKDERNMVKMTDIDGNTHIFYMELNCENKINKDDYIVTFIDITAIQNMEHHLIQSEKMASLGEMIGNIAHQWRQPLNVVSTASSGLLVEKELGVLSDKQFEESLNLIVENTQFLSETIDTFRDFIKEKKEFKEQNIQELIDKTLTLVSASLKNNYIKLINNINYDIPINKNMVVGELAQVITNLIKNAQDILLENKISDPFIKIDCEIVNDEIVISVEDNGGGVPEEIINSIFEPYFTTKHQSIGTGLGLYMSQKIIKESLNGELKVRNGSKGAIFSIIIPMD